MEQKVEYFIKPLVEAKPKLKSIYTIIIIWLLLILYSIYMSSEFSILITIVIVIIFSFFSYFFFVGKELAYIKIYNDSINIKYPFLPLRNNFTFSFNLIQGILFSERPTYGTGKRGSSKMIFYYRNSEGIDKIKRFCYRLDINDLQNIVSTLKNLGVKIKGDDNYLNLSK